MKVISTQQMGEIEEAANAAGLPYDTMMENAGKAAALAARKLLHSPSSHILVLVGPGNNGGDGLVAARYLHAWGHHVTVYIWKRERERDPNLQKVQDLKIPIKRADQDAAFEALDALVQGADMILDALLGTGVKGSLRGDLPSLLSHVSEGLKPHERQRTIPAFRLLTPSGPSLRGASWQREPSSPDRPLVVAVDTPSGLDCDTGEVDEHTLQADLTVTFAAPKPGLFLFPGAARVGKLLVVDIGIDPQFAADVPLQVATPESVGQSLPKRPLNAHKGSFGKVLIVAGSANYVGAPCLASEAAYRVGAGLVTLAAANAIYPSVTAKLTEATFLVLPDDMGALTPAALPLIAEGAEDYDVLLVGPGLGTDKKTGAFVQTLLRGEKQVRRPSLGFEVSEAEPKETFTLPPLVIDADALNLMADKEQWWKELPTESVITPHPGEMARLLHCKVEEILSDRIGTATETAENWGCTVVLKGAYTIVASPTGEATIIPFANPALATAGTGDVLAGAIAGLMAQGLSGYEAAVCGAYIHGLAGEKQPYGSGGMVAGDLLPELPKIMDQLRGL
ncbi:MAG: NAD(P)H-hydrate dehydratase [Chloroflexota bacterium]|nr:NAD(P)H-hydrate dehydratase [Chloroflexota bacterium]